LISNSSGFDTAFIARLYAIEPVALALDKSNPCVLFAAMFVPILCSLAGLSPSNPS